MSKKRIHLICQECAVLNGGKWKPHNVMVSLSLGPCQVCGSIKPIVQVLHWKGLSITKEFKSSLPPPLPLSKKKIVAKEEVNDKISNTGINIINNDILS